MITISSMASKEHKLVVKCVKGELSLQGNRTRNLRDEVNESLHLSKSNTERTDQQANLPRLWFVVCLNNFITMDVLLLIFCFMISLKYLNGKKWHIRESLGGGKNQYYTKIVIDENDADSIKFNQVGGEPQ